MVEVFVRTVIKNLSVGEGWRRMSVVEEYKHLHTLCYICRTAQRKSEDVAECSISAGVVAYRAIVVPVGLALCPVFVHHFLITKCLAQ